MSVDKEQLNQIYRQIHNVLLDEWDPDHIKQIPAARTEYDAFVESIYSLLEAHASEEQIYEALKLIALQDLGIPKSSELDIATKNTAAKLKKLVLTNL
ncbi:MAG: hypothetical protein KC733_05510 [Candidatus Omnitrophica bacterium]|nr:hypothetical protein [Candidatus Omnitrophota bacterium]